MQLLRELTAIMIKETHTSVKVRIVVAIALAASTTSCQTAAQQPEAQTKPYQLNASEIAAVQTGVKESLKDPTSAIFSDQFKATEDMKSPGIVYVCGLVNAKNSFGGYAGKAPFMGILGTMKGGKVAVFNVTTMGGTENDTAVTMSLCQHYGVM